MESSQPEDLDSRPDVYEDMHGEVRIRVKNIDVRPLRELKKAVALIKVAIDRNDGEYFRAMNKVTIQ